MSSEGQRDAATIQVQVEKCKKLVEQHNLKLLNYGPTNDGLLLDNGISGTLLEGRCLWTFLEDLKARRVHPDYLVTYSFSRLARQDLYSKDPEKLEASAVAAARVKARLQGFKVQILDGDGPADAQSLSTRLKSELANEEHKTTLGRTSDGKHRVLRSGSWPGGKVPFGYSLEGDRRKGHFLTPHPEQAPQLVQLLHWFVQGGYRFAARKATEAGFTSSMGDCFREEPREGRTKTSWFANSVFITVRNVSVYLGSTTYTFEGVGYELTYPAIITDELAQEVNRRRKDKAYKRRVVFFSSGFCDCSQCGKHLNNRATHDHHLVSCFSGGCCGVVRQDLFEYWLWISICCRLIQIRRHEGHRQETINHSAEVQLAQGEVDKINNQLEGLMKLHLAGGDLEVFQRMNEELKLKKSEAQSRLTQAKGARDASLARETATDTLEAELFQIIEEMRASEPTLDRKREVTSRLFQGQRVGISFHPRGGRRLSPGCTITLPAFGALPAVTVDTKGEIWTQILGQEFIAGRYVSTQYAGQGQEVAERTLLAKLRSVGGRVLSRKVLPDGSVELVKQGETYPW